MMTSVAIEDQRLRQVVNVGDCRTKDETVAPALRAFIQRRQWPELVKLLGDAEFDSKYDYEQDRR